MKRRAFTAAALAAFATRPALAQRGEVIIATTAGLMERSLQEHFYRRFERDTGIRVRSVPIELPDQWARAVAGARTGNVPFDIVTATPPDLIQHRDILQPLDCDGMAGVRENALPGACYPHGLMRTGGAMTLVWSKRAFGDRAMEGWADFFDVQKFPGPRALPDTGDREWWVPVAALLADGVAREALFPLDLDRAYRKLTALKPQVAAWWRSGDQIMQLMRSGEAVATMSYSSRSVPLAKSGDFDFTWNQAIRDVGNWAVLRNGPNTANAIRFLDFFVQNPEEHVVFSGKVSFDSNNRNAAALVPPEERRFRPSLPDNWSRMVIADYEWIAANRERMRERWLSWLTA
ncbi:extracellular solute-binding protein [Elioraea tepidiphila]|jgi:spermidine/putrescine-binding protein|uniref:extracellular solute-binding protein n=1 Tax=Elioraea tepidiphila TaxID=457934 RepID=UPI000360AEEA|nr:extracellular solute-binding protein [Elioraea tepidiphila]